MPFISTSKQAELLTAVQLNPEILTDDASFVTDIIDRAGRYICDAVGLERYPDGGQGESVSGASPSTDISSLATGEILVSIDGSQFYEISLELANCTTGLLTAAEFQTQLQAVDVGPFKFATVTYANSLYTITSPTYGEGSSVSVSYDTEYEHVAYSLKMSPDFGGEEFAGSDAKAEYDDVTIRLVNHWYNTVGVEGMASFSVQGVGSYSSAGMEPYVAQFIANNRRIVR